MSARPVHVVVVAYHAADKLDRCLAGLQARAVVTVIDNSSSPQVASVAKRHGAAYVDAGANRGFAAGVNIALGRQLAGEDVDVLLLNPDAVVSPQVIAELSRFLHRPEQARVAALSPRIRRAGGLEQRVVWPFPSPARMWVEAVGLSRLPVRATFVIGAVLLLRREAIEDVGPFDERFFLYAEETDWQRRARTRGWRSELYADGVADHVAGGTSSDPRRQQVLFEAAQETYIRKWYGARGWAIYRLAACLGGAARALIPGGRGRSAAQRTMLYLRGPRRCAALLSD
jgi:GT2 family glycosyltransferase